MIQLQRTSSSNKDFVELVKLLDTELSKRDGEEHAFYDQFNSIDNLNQVVLASEKGQVIGCGAIKALDKQTIEVKRMFVRIRSRGKGIAKLMLSELENWAFELGYDYCNLETGKRQPEAIALYKRAGYRIIINYGQYAGVENSICFQKALK